jgi:hypothetical protein
MRGQLIMIAKLELFFGQPIYSMMIVLTAFLIFNSLGAAFVNWWNQTKPDHLPVAAPAIMAIILTPACFLAMDQLVHLIGLGLFGKASLAVASLAPVAFVLGMFYPLGVRLTVARGLEKLVPMTFGLATLSSVIGGVFTLVFVINLGFWNMIFIAVSGYLVLTLIVLRPGQ